MLAFSQSLRHLARRSALQAVRSLQQPQPPTTSHTSLPPLSEIVAHLDDLLDTARTPDYPAALNGLQVENSGQVTRVAAAVDASQRAIDGAIQANAHLLIVHHGLFWSGLQPLAGRSYRRISALLSHDVAVYSAHLPLDRHPTLGNNVLLAQRLNLVPSGEFAHFEGMPIGVRGISDIATADLVARADAFAREHGGEARVSAVAGNRRTRAWGVCTGAGADADTLDEAERLGLDTLIVGEGPHWTTVEAPERGLVIIYAGHYATETLGVRALAEHLGQRFDIPWSFVAAPTGT
jgi:dinuclear metal center YbgI/SA1388 family protein